MGQHMPPTLADSGDAMDFALFTAARRKLPMHTRLFDAWITKEDIWAYCAARRRPAPAAVLKRAKTKILGGRGRLAEVWSWNAIVEGCRAG